MRHAVRWVASVALLLGAIILLTTATVSPDPAEVFRAGLTDFGVALVDLAITVGVVDLLLRSYSEKQHRASVAPRVQELILQLRAFAAVRDKHLGRPSLADLERYRRAAVDVQQGAFGLYILMSTSNAILASELLRLSHEMREHLEAVEDAMASLRNEAADVTRAIEGVKNSGADLFESGSLLTDQLIAKYPAAPYI